MRQFANQADFEKKYNETNRRLLSERMIEHEISDEWYYAAAGAFHLASPANLAVDTKDYIKIRDKAYHKQPLNYFEFGVLSNNLQIRSPKEMESITCCNYDKLMLEVDELLSKVQPIFKEIGERTMVEIVGKPEPAMVKTMGQA